MESSEHLSENIDFLISEAQGQIDRNLLDGTGEGGLLSGGYLSDNPFHALLSDNEVPHYLFSSTKKAPQIDDTPQCESLGNYRAITAVTSSRILYAMGTPSGDIINDIAYSEIKRIGFTNERLFLRRIVALYIETEDHEYKFYGAGDLDRGSVLDYVRNQTANAEQPDVDSNANTSEITDENIATEDTPDNYSSNQREQVTEPDEQGSEDMTKREQMIETLHELHSTLGRIPLATDIQEKTTYSQYDYTTEFGSIDEALSEAGYDKREALLQELTRVAEELDKVPTTVDMEKHAAYSSGLYTKYFESWGDALDAAGFNDGTNTLTGKSTDSEQDQSQGQESDTETNSSNEADADHPDPSEEELLDALRALNERLDTIPKYGDMNEMGRYGAHLYTATFGTWDQALEETGIDKGAGLLAELERVAQKLDRIPSTSQMSEHGRYSPSMYADYFGSWTEALEELEWTDPSRSDLLAVLRSQIQELERLPTEDEINRGKYSAKLYRTEFGSLEAAFEAADINNTTEESSSDSWSDRELVLLVELDRLAAATGGPLKATDLRDNGQYAVHEYTDTFGSWDEALEAAGIDRESELLDEIERVWEHLGEQPSTGDMNEHGRVSSATITNYFGSWEAACQQADPNLDQSIQDSPASDEEADVDTDLSSTEIERIHDLVRLQPTKNSELMRQWGLDSGSAVHNYLEAHLKSYYYRDENSYIRPTSEAEELLEKIDSSDTNTGQSKIETTPHRRDLLLSLTELAQTSGDLPNAEQIDEQTQYPLEQYQNEFEDLFEAYQLAGMIPENATRADFDDDISFDLDLSDHSKQETNSSQTGIDDELKKKQLFSDDEVL